MTELLYNSEPLTIAESLFGVSERHRLTFNLNPSWRWTSRTQVTQPFLAAQCPPPPLGGQSPSPHRISIQQEGKRGGGRLFFPQIEPN